MNANKSTVKTGYYICSNRGRPAPYGCDAPGIPMAIADNAVIEAVSFIILTPEHQLELIKILDKETEKSNSQQQENLKAMEQQLEKNQREESNVRRLIRNLGADPEIDNAQLERALAKDLIELQEEKSKLLEAKIQEGSPGEPDDPAHKIKG